MKSTLYPRSLVFLGALLAVAAAAPGCRRTRDRNASTNGVGAQPAQDPNVALDRQGVFAPRAAGAAGASAADHYEIHVNAGERIVVSLESTAFDPILEVVLPNGTPLVNDDYQGSRQRSQIVVTPATAGDLKVRVRSYAAGSGGAYHVSAQRSQVAQNTNALAVPPRHELNAVVGMGSHSAPFLEFIQPSESRTHHRLPATYPALTPLRAGAEITGTLAQTDTSLPSGEHADYYSFEGQIGQSVAIAMNSTTMDSYLMLVAPSGQVFADDDSGGTTNAQLSIVLPEAGQYRLIASATRAGVMGSYDLKFNPTQRVVNTQEWFPNQPAQPTNNGSQVAPVAVPVPTAGPGQSRTGTLAQGDATLQTGEFVDRYNYNWPVGTTIRLRLESSAFDPYVIVRAPSGQQQDNDDFSPSDRNSQLDYTVREAGQHTVSVTSYRPGETGAYQLTVGGAGAAQPSQPGFPTQPGTPVQIIPTVQPGQPGQPGQPTANMGSQTVAGTLAQGDGTRQSGEFADNFTFNFPAGAMIRLETTSPEFDTFLLVRSPSGIMQQNDDGIPGTTNSALDLQTNEAGPYTITVSSYRAGETGPYQLMVRAPGAGQVMPGQPVAVVPTQPTQPTQPAQPTNQPSGSLSREIRGALAAGDRTLQSGEFVDGHSVQFRPGESVRVRLDSSAFDTYLIMRSPSGHQLDNDDFVSGNTNSGVDIPSAEAGNYQVQVTSYRPGETGAYVLHMDHGSAGSLPSDNPNNPTNPNNPVIPVQPNNGGPRVWGVFAGITDYPGGVNDLPECANDAVKLVETLTNRGLLTADRRVLLTDGQVTRDGVRQAIRRIGAQAGPQDVFMFFYSGHGGRTNGGSADARELDNMDEYLFLYDGQFMDDEMGTLFDGIRARTSILALDSCYAGGFAKDVITRPGRVGLFSSEEDVTSSVAQQFRAGGFLSHFLRTGMGGEADGDPRDNALTVGELTHFVWRQFALNVQNEREGGGAYQHLVVDRGAVGVGQVLWNYPR